MWPRSDLMQLLGTEHPLIQAPMSGVTTPELAAAVANAGALGSLGCGILPNALVRDQVAAVRRMTGRPINVNVFAHPRPIADARAAERARARLQRYYDEVGLGPVPEPMEPFPAFDSERLELLLELRPPVVSFHFGMPDAQALRRLKQAGVVVLASATTVAEARAIEGDGVDAVIAQGFEAGGHRGTFFHTPGAGMIGTMALLPQVVDAVRVPVIAAGGIFDGRGIAAAFKLGASGVQMGTAFLGCPESNVPPPYRAALRAAADDGTQLTRAFTGLQARVLRNRFSTEMQADGGEVQALAFPLQGALTMPLGRSADGSTIRTDFLPMWAGQGVPKLREMPAAELVRKLVAEARAQRM